MLKIEYNEIFYESEKKREYEHICAYRLLEKMLFECFQISPPVIKRTDMGKPYVENDGVFFSISHTDGLVCCAVSDTPVGIDCEKITTKFDKKIESFANRYFLENEINLLKNEEFSPLRFYKIWTAKEAIYKMQGGVFPITKIDTLKNEVTYIFEKDYIICVKN